MVRLAAIVTVMLAIGFLIFGSNPAKAATVICASGNLTWEHATSVTYYSDGIIVFKDKLGQVVHASMGQCAVVDTIDEYNFGR